MTANELLKMACSMCFEKTQDYKENAVDIINAVLAETFHYNNDRRRYKQLDELVSPPTIASLEDEIPYESELNVGLSMQLCSKLLYDDGEVDKCMYWQTLAFDLFQGGRKATYYQSDGAAALVN